MKFYNHYIKKEKNIIIYEIMIYLIINNIYLS